MTHFKGWSTSLKVGDYIDVSVIPMGVSIAASLAGGKIGYLYGEKMGGCP